MAPVRLNQPNGKRLAVVHRCTVCGHESTNRLATDDPCQPDSWQVIAQFQQSMIDSGRRRQSQAAKT